MGYMPLAFLAERVFDALRFGNSMLTSEIVTVVCKKIRID